MAAEIFAFSLRMDKLVITTTAFMDSLDRMSSQLVCEFASHMGYHYEDCGLEVLAHVLQLSSSVWIDLYGGSVL